MIKVDVNLLAQQILKLNQDFAGEVVEKTGNNDGEQIDKIEAIWGLKGEPYCAMGQYWVFAKAYCQLAKIEFNNDPKSPKYCVKVFANLRKFIEENYLYFHPACRYMINRAMKDRIWRSYRKQNDARLITPGSFLFYDFASGDATQHHVEQFISFDGDVMTLVGWNTKADKDDTEGKTNDPKNGGGCFIKHRHPDKTVLGWIDWIR